MRDLGNFGVENASTPTDFDDFGWFGTRVRVQADVNEVELVDLMASARTVDTQDMAAIGIVKDMFTMVIHPDDFDAFWAAAKRHRQKIADLVELFQTLLEAVTDRPTQQPSDSSNGPRQIGASSPDGSPSSDSTGPREPVTSAHRPDLQVIHEDNAASRARIAARVAAG